jgi:hypothetical protein
VTCSCSTNYVLTVCQSPYATKTDNDLVGRGGGRTSTGHLALVQWKGTDWRKPDSSWGAVHSWCDLGCPAA